ncbi:MAG: DMT family transporter [Thaumarchaeota archaeon]|nr:DMT family transporter [Nitrososphaerota archaeon]
MVRPALNLKEWIALACLLAVWGTSFIFVKVGLAYSPPFIFAALRQIVGAAAMVPFLLNTREAIPKSRRELFPLFLLGIFNITLTNGASFTALQTVPAGLATVIAYTQPVWVFIFAVVILKESSSARKVLGTILGFLGIAIIFLPGIQVSQAYFSGQTLLVFSSFAWAIGAILFKAKVKTESLYMVNFIMLLFGAAPLLAVSLLTEDLGSIQWTPTFAVSLFQLGILAQSVGWTLWLFLIRRLGASKTSSSLFLTPIVTLVIGVVFLNESLSVLEVIGASAALTGTYLVSKSL